ncbi:MAG: GHKL domain-containing protein [Bdellovibrionaceae bacterium]|nr:GHKL domain-containing protein [Pseudobdellovibrionaceae bacterium]
MLGEDWPTNSASKASFTADLAHNNLSIVNVSLRELMASDFKFGELDALALIIINLSLSELEVLLQRVDLSQLSTTIVLRLTSADVNIVDWVNQRNISHFIQDESAETLSRILDLSRMRMLRRTVIRQIAEQSKSTDQVVQDQEEKIIAKTLDIELSNQEQNQKLKRERQLLKFLKDVAMADFYDSFLRSVKNEFKIFHELGEIFIVDVKSETDLSILNLKVMDRWKDYKIHESFDFMLSKNLSTFFANVFQRPFGRVIATNLKGNCFLIVESHLSDIQNIQFQEFLSDRQEILKIVFDKIDNEEKMNSFSFRWEKIFDFIKDPIAVIDENYNVVACNNAFEKVADQKKCFQIFAGSEQPCMGCPLQQNKSTGELRGGNIIVGNSSYDVVAFGLEASFVHTYKDQTESNRLQLELIHKKKMATIGKLAGHLSHELNNPLTGIRSMAQVLMKEAEAESNPQALKDLTEIESAAQRSLSVIRNFIEFSDNKNCIELTDIHKLIERTIPLMKTSLRNHILLKDLNAQKYSARVNPSLFQQVLFNLIKNAIQSMGEKGRVQIQTSNPTSTVIRVSVSDTGKGIPKAVQHLIFQPFFTTKDKTQGNGLGLSIVRSIVESFHGQISFTSEEGVGTQFHIELPVASRDENLSH